MNIREELKRDAIRRFGPQAGQVIEYLYDMGTLDDTLARRHMIAIAAFDAMCSTDMSGLQIDEELAVRYSVSRMTVNRCRLG